MVDFKYFILIFHIIHDVSLKANVGGMKTKYVHVGSVN